MRFPRLETEQDKAKAERLAELRAETWKCIKRGIKANLEIGRHFNQIKDIVGHGNWRDYYKRHFGNCGIPDRTARTYMSQAHEEDRKSAESADLAKRNVGPKAQELLTANEQAKKNTAAAPRVYRLPLHATPDEQQMFDALRQSADWPQHETQIVSFILKLKKVEAQDANATAAD